MFRATVREVKSPTDVVVTIDKLFGGGMVRARSRIEVTVGERVLVDDLSAGRVHDWMVVDFENVIGRWGNTGPHTHPIGQVDGLKDFLDTYGEFMGDHEDRMKYAEGKLVEADAAIAQGRLDMLQAEQDLAAARDRITKAETELTYADQRISVGEAERAAAIARLDTAELEILAAGTRIGATENLLSTLDNRVESAETTVQVTAGKLDTVDTRLTTTAGELAALSGTVGDVSAAVATAEGKAARAETAANQASAVASEAMSEYDGLRVKLDAALAARPGLIADSSFELPDQWDPAYGASIIASTAARTGSKLLVLPWQNRNTGTGKPVHAYSRQDVQVIKGHHYRLTVYLNSTDSIDGAKGNFLVRRGAAGSKAYITQTTRIDLVDSGITQGGWRVFQAEWTAPESYDVNFGFQAASLASDLYVDDLQAVDSTAEASLQIAVEDARQKAEAAARDAMAALTAANQAQTAANGKTNVLYTTTPYAGMGTAMGDTNFVMSSLGGGGKVLRQRRWTGNSWEDVQFDHQVIASVDLGKATVGELDGQRISARTLTADRFQVGVAGNLIVDPNFNDATISNWRLGGRWQWGNTDGETYFRAWGNGTITDMGLNGGKSKAPSLPVASGMSYALTLDVKGTIGVYLAIRYANGHINTPGSSVQTSPHSATRRIHTFIITPDNYIVAGAEGTKPVEIQINLRQPSSAPVGGDTTVYSAKFAPRTSSVLIEDGAVTAAKVNAESVAGAVGQFVKVQAANVEVTSELAARVVNAMTANVRNLVVTESAILQHTTLLGTTVASELNVTKLLRGRDAILSGTIDVAQLNVTNTMSAAIVNAMDVATQKLVVTEEALLNHATLLGTTVAERLNVTKQLIGRDAILTGTVDVDQLNVTSTMSAEIVRAMNTTTKRLIVTEDAILNRATVVQDLVTRDLIAQRVDSRYLRSDSIQTGLLEVFGRFRTAPDGQPQIIIQPSQTAWNSRDLAVWFTPDGSLPGGGDATQFEVTGGMWMNPTRNTGTSWSPQQLNLRGQSRAGVQIMDGLTVRATAGTAGPTIMSHPGQFLSVIGSDGVGLSSRAGDARIVPWKSAYIIARNDGVVEMESERRVHLKTGRLPVRFTSPGSGHETYEHTTGSASNAVILENGNVFRSTSSRRYKKDITDWVFDVERLRDFRLRRWYDKVGDGSGRRYSGAIAEEVAALYPEVVPTIDDPTHVDGDGKPLPNAPQVPDSIDYDRLALAAAVAGWQDADKRLRALEEKLATLGI